MISACRKSIYINVGNWHNGGVKDGDWDTKRLAVEELDTLIAFRQHFQEGLDWDKTAFYQRIQSQIDKGIVKWGCKSREDLVNRFKGLDQLYLDIKENGYKTAAIGKWHLGYTPALQPTGQGFDYHFGHLVGCIDNYSHFYYWRGPNRHDLYQNGTEIYRDGEYFPELCSKEAIQFMEENATHPFFFLVTYFIYTVPPAFY